MRNGIQILIMGDSDKTPPSRDSRSQEGNDEKLQQQDCHITVYHSES